MLTKIYHELVLIRKELQAIRNSLEPKTDIKLNTEKLCNTLKNIEFKI